MQRKPGPGTRSGTSLENSSWDAVHVHSTVQSKYTAVKYVWVFRINIHALCAQNCMHGFLWANESDFSLRLFWCKFLHACAKNNLTEILHIFLIKSEMLDSHIILDENTLSGTSLAGGGSLREMSLIAYVHSTVYRASILR